MEMIYNKCGAVIPKPDLKTIRDGEIEHTYFLCPDCGEAFEYMAMAGWKTGDMLDGIEVIMNLAAASGEDLGTTSPLLKTMMAPSTYGRRDFIMLPPGRLLRSK